MNSSQAEQLRAVIGWIFASGFMFLGLVFLALGGYEFWQGLKTKNWPAAPGRIIESEIESISSTSRSSSRVSRRVTDYSVRIRYSYEAAGQKLEGKRLQYGYNSHDDRSSAKNEQSRYPPGKEVQVFYDPTNPKRSVLVKGSGTSWLAVGLGLTAFLLGLFTMVYMAIMRRVGVREKISGS
jgi:hypothetical protein